MSLQLDCYIGGVITQHLEGARPGVASHPQDSQLCEWVSVGLDCSFISMRKSQSELTDILAKFSLLVLLISASDLPLPLPSSNIPPYIQLRRIEDSGIITTSLPISTFTCSVGGLQWVLPTSTHRIYVCNKKSRFLVILPIEWKSLLAYNGMHIGILGFPTEHVVRA